MRVMRCFFEASQKFVSLIPCVVDYFTMGKILIARKPNGFDNN